MGVVELKNLEKRYKNGRGVSDITLNIEEGQIFGILGPNGSGKTTIMKMMAGLIRPTGGSLRMFGLDPQESREKILELTGCFIETPVFYPYMTALQNMEAVQKYCKHPSTGEVLHLLKLTGIDSYGNDKTSKFSLGMKQRLGIAMALVGNPNLLILDEPANGLDIEGRADIKKLIKAEAKRGKTVIIASHIAEEIGQICTNTVVLKEGRIIDTADVSSVLQEYGTIENYYLSLISGKKEDAS